MLSSPDSASISRTIAEPADVTTTSEALDWLLSQPGGGIVHVNGHAPRAESPTGELRDLPSADSGSPRALLGMQLEGPPFAGWIRSAGVRLFLSWGEEGYRLLHPRPKPDPEQHLESAASFEAFFRTTASQVVYGPSGAGKSLLCALLAGDQAAQGRRVLSLTGLPRYDVGDGGRVVHVVATPGGDVAALRAVVERWQPETVVLDFSPSREIAPLVRDCRLAGLRVVLTLRAADLRSARESTRMLAGESQGWQYASPWPVAPGPRLEISLDPA